MKNIRELYDPIKELSNGGFGTVWEATHKKLQCPCAIKQIPKTVLKKAEVYEDLMWQEIETLDKYDHPNIVRVLDFCEDKGYIYIVFELMMSGDLSKNLRLIKQNLPTLSMTSIEATVANIMHQVIMAITFLHKQGCVHRDLKPENVLVKYERIDDNQTRATCKVTDFGFAKVFN